MTSKSEGGTGFPLPNISGRARLNLLGVLACSLLAFGFILLLQTPAQAWVAKAKSCSSASCHGNTDPGVAINVSVNGSPGTAVTVAPGGTFEVDWTFTNLANSYGVNPEIAVPTGWTVAAGTANSPTVNGGWNTVWDAADGVSWNTSYSTTDEFAGSPVGYSISYGGTPWDKNRNSAFDDASATTPGDRDRTAEKMGTDARITVPAGTTPGTYTVMVLGIGHVAAGRAHVEQAITVTVSSGISQTIAVGTPAPASAAYNSQFTVAATASSGLPVTYSSGSTSICTNSGATFTMVSGTGTCIVQYDQAGGSGYAAAPRVTNNVTATKINQATVTASAPINATYGQTGLSATASGGSGTGAYSYSAGSSTACTVNASSGALTITSGTGTCSITATRATDSNYNVSATSSPATVAVNKAPLAVTAAAKSKTYGAVDPALTYTATGFVNGDTSAIMTGSLTRVAGENVGNYAINQGTVAANSNYSITYTGANLTINAAPLAVTAAAKNKTYGGTDPALTYTATGFVNGDTNAVMTGSLTRLAGENVGNYAINQGSVAANSNYAITYTGANLTINAAPLTVTAAAKGKTYGGTDPALTYTATGFVNGDTNAIMTGSLTRVAGENVGNYAINQGSVAATSNYTIAYTGANLTISAAPLTVTAAATNKTYGGADPALTYTTTGFVNGDTTAIMTGALTRVAGENVGNYAINQGSVAANNYAIAYTGADLTINAAPLTVTAAAKSKTYGGTDPALTYTVTGFVNGDTNAVMTGSLTRVAGENVGNYAINQGSVAANSNYTIAYSGANLTINAAPLTVIAAAKNKTYGGTDPALTYTATGFVNGDTVSVMTGSLTRVAGENAGNYAINQGSVAANNYTITYTGANLTISAAPLTVTAAAKGKAYGAVDPALTYTATGFVNGDTTAVMTGALTRVAGENVGNYAINQGSVAANNYTITYTGADLTISAAPLTVTAAATNKTYGGTDPALTYTATGFVNGDTTAIMTGALNRVAGENVGNYAINQGTVSANNYTITYNGANLTIDPAALTITAEAKSKTYGGTDPALTYTVSGFVNGDTTAIMTGGLTRASGENTGNYAINQGTVAATSNYTVSYTGANLTIDPATLTVTANDQTKTQGSVNPPLTITYSGFVNGDTETSLTTQPTATTTATTASPAGPYPIIPDGGISSNYTFNYVVGTLTVTAAGNPTLNVTVSGNGSVNSVPSGIACTGGTCSADFTSGQSVDLTAATSWNYDFTGWIGGACDGTTTNPCTLIVNSPTDVTATFTAKQLVKLPGGNYPSVQEAYAVAIEGETMQLRDQTFSEDLDFNRTVQVKLDGGWNADYTSVSGDTTIDGTVTISSGGITISNVIIQ